jgi:hypothetical protein
LGVPAPHHRPRIVGRPDGRRPAFSRRLPGAKTHTGREEPPQRRLRAKSPAPRCWYCWLVAGAVSGLIGIGGGVVIRACPGVLVWVFATPDGRNYTGAVDIAGWTAGGDALLPTGYGDLRAAALICRGSLALTGPRMAICGSPLRRPASTRC